MKKSFPLLALTVLAMLSSCAAIREHREQIKKAEVNVSETQEISLFEWNTPGLTGKPSVRIDLSDQKAYVMDNGQEVAWTYVASGVAGRSTPTGRFTIMEKVADKHSNIWGIIVDANGDMINSDAHSSRSPIPKGGRFVGAPMPNWMRLTSYGIGMHAGVIPDPGFPASHGCIRLPEGMAAMMFEHLPEGTPVEVTP